MFSLQRKLKILKHTEKYGMQSSIDAFGVKKSSIYLWNKKLLQNNQAESVLMNKSTRPKNFRTRKGNWDYWIEEHIQKLRITHPGITKEKVWKLLQTENIKRNKQNLKLGNIPSIATIGRMIQDLKKNRQIPDWSRKLSFYANTSTFRIKQKKKIKKLRPIKQEFKYPGQRIQIDCVIILKKGIRRYLVNDIDVYSRITFSYAYKSLTSNSTKDFLVKMRQVFPFISSHTQIQNDNGSEFMKNFQQYLQQESITQYWNYP